MKTKALLVVFLLIIATVPLLGSISPAAHAASPSISAMVNSHQCAGNLTGAITCKIHVTQYDAIIAFATCLSPTLACGLQVITASDNESNSFTEVAAEGVSCSFGSCVEFAFSANASATHTDAITFRSTGTVPFFGADIYDVHGSTLAGLVTSAGASPAGSSVAVSSFSAASGGLVLSAAVASPATSLSWAAGSGYTLVTGQPQYEAHNYWQASEYGAVGGPTTAPFTLTNGGGGFAEVAISLASSSAPPPYTITACSYTQLQCWWYPFLFFMLYGVIFMMVGAIGGASRTGMNVLLLAGLDNAALAATTMGILNFTVPLLFIVLTVVYFVRSK